MAPQRLRDPLDECAYACGADGGGGRKGLGGAGEEEVEEAEAEGVALGV